MDIPNASILQRIKSISCLSKQRDETTGIPGFKLTNQKLPREGKRKHDRPLCTQAGKAGHSSTYIGGQQLSLVLSPSTSPDFLDNLVQQPPGSSHSFRSHYRGLHMPNHTLLINCLQARHFRATPATPRGAPGRLSIPQPFSTDTIPVNSFYRR